MLVFHISGACCNNIIAMYVVVPISCFWINGCSYILITIPQNNMGKCNPTIYLRIGLLVFPKKWGNMLRSSQNGTLNLTLKLLCP